MAQKNKRDSKHPDTSLEIALYRVIDTILVSTNDWIIILLSSVIWVITGFIPYSTNMNFDMAANLSSYIQFLSLAAIAFGLFTGHDDKVSFSKKIQSLGVLTYTLSLLTLIMSKNFGVISDLGFFLIKPVCIFTFLLILKYVWLNATIQE